MKEGSTEVLLENQQSIKVHFKGYAAKWDEIIQVWDSPSTFSQRILEIGAITKAHGAAKYDENFQKMIKQ